MDLSEWGFLIKNNEDIEEVILLVEAHNTCPNQNITGEDLRIYAIIKENISGNIYICCGNEGGRDMTNEFIEENYNGHVFWPFEKPSWWNNPSEYTYLWKRSTTTYSPVSTSGCLIY